MERLKKESNAKAAIISGNYRDTIVMVVAIAVLNIFDYHSTFLIMSKFGVMNGDGLTETNRYFWFFFRQGLNYPIALLLTVLIDFIIILGWLFIIYKCLNKKEASAYYLLIITMFAFTLTNNYLLYNTYPKYIILLGLLFIVATSLAVVIEISLCVFGLVWLVLNIMKKVKQHE